MIANEEDIQAVLGLSVAGADVIGGHLDVDAYRTVAEQITRELGPSMVAITLRESLSASDNGWSAVLWDGKANQFHQSQRYDVRLVDRIGGGDSFAAGLIYGLVTGRSAADSLRFAVAASALKQSIPGDFNRVERRRSRSARGRRRLRPRAAVGIRPHQTSTRHQASNVARSGIRHQCRLQVIRMRFSVTKAPCWRARRSSSNPEIPAIRCRALLRRHRL